jgi:hypothetical protein
MAQARREAKTQQMAERKNVIGESGGVGIVFFNLQFRFVVEQTIEYIRGISCGRIDELGLERGVLVRNVGIEGHPRIIAVTRIDLSVRGAVTAGAKALPVRRRRSSITPMASKTDAVVIIDELGKRLGIGLLANMPSSHAAEYGKWDAWRGLGHASQAQVDSVCKDGGQQQRPVLSGLTVAQVCEVARESGPFVDLDEKIGDLDARE